MDYQVEYYRRHPTFHLEDSRWKVQDFSKVFTGEFSAQSIVDVGCGAGFVLQHFVSLYNVEQAIGIDISESAIAFARDQHRNSNIQWLCEDVFLTKLGKVFDVGLSSDVLEHVKDDLLFLKVIAGLAKRIVIRIPIEDNLIHRVLRRFTSFDPWEDTKKRFGHLHHYSLSSVQKLFLDAGLTIEEVTFCPLRKRSRFWFELVRRILNPLTALSPRLSMLLCGGFVVISARGAEA